MRQSSERHCGFGVDGQRVEGYAKLSTLSVNLDRAAQLT